jgi:hypothetical protein
MHGALLAGAVVAVIGIEWVGVDPTPAMVCGLLVAYLLWPTRKGNRR